jgi:hypothetical protein
MSEKPSGQRSVLGDSANAEPVAYLTAVKVVRVDEDRRRTSVAVTTAHLSGARPVVRAPSSRRDRWATGAEFCFTVAKRGTSLLGQRS